MNTIQRFLLKVSRIIPSMYSIIHLEYILSIVCSSFYVWINAPFEPFSGLPIGWLTRNCFINLALTNTVSGSNVIMPQQIIIAGLKEIERKIIKEGKKTKNRITQEEEVLSCTEKIKRLKQKDGKSQRRAHFLTYISVLQVIYMLQSIDFNVLATYCFHIWHLLLFFYLTLICFSHLPSSNPLPQSHLCIIVLLLQHHYDSRLGYTANYISYIKFWLMKKRNHSLPSGCGVHASSHPSFTSYTYETGPFNVLNCCIILHMHLYAAKFGGFLTYQTTGLQAKRKFHQYTIKELLRYLQYQHPKSAILFRNTL